MESKKLKRPRLEEGNLRVEDSYDNQKDEDYEPEIQTKSTNKKQPSAGRIWSDEQEITILNGVIKFSTEKKIDPFTNKSELVAFMKESLDCDFTKPQLVSKLKRMKRKFRNNIIKGKAISGPHQNKVFELSNKIWGDANAVALAVADADEPDISLPCRKEMLPADLDEMFSGLGEDIVEEVLAKTGEGERAEFKKQWNELQVLELELTLKRAQLIEFETRIILDSYKSSKNAVTDLI